MGVLTITDDSQFQCQLAYNVNKLVVVEFTSAWCGKCLLMNPVFEKLSKAYSCTIFLKVDVDVCRNIVKAQGLSSVPTFVFYRNKVQIDSTSCDDEKVLNCKIKQYLGENSNSIDGLALDGHVDLLPFIKESEALNAFPPHPFEHLEDRETFLKSLADKQIILSIYFSQAVKIYSLSLTAPSTNGPKIVKLFINQPNSLGFDEAENNIPTQTLETESTKLSSGWTTKLRYVKFQNVNNVHIFIEDNHDDSDVTFINQLQLFGSPISTTNMKNFNPVAIKRS